MSNISTWFYAKWVRSRIASEAISELKGAKLFLKYTGVSMTPDTLKETLRLSQSGATLGRKLREAAEDYLNPELLKRYYDTKNNRRVVEFSWNAYYKEAK
jgi:hypothetical protein